MDTSQPQNTNPNPDDQSPGARNSENRETENQNHSREYQPPVETRGDLPAATTRSDPANTSIIWGESAPKKQRTFTLKQGLIAAGVAVVVAGGGGAAVYAASNSSSQNSESRGGQNGFGGQSFGNGDSRTNNQAATSELTALHAEYVIEENGSYVTRLRQKGEVTAKTDTTVTIKSADGYTLTYALLSSTQYSSSTTSGNSPMGNGTGSEQSRTNGSQGGQGNQANQGGGSDGNMPQPPSGNNEGQSSGENGMPNTNGTGSSSTASLSDVSVGKTVTITATKSDSANTALTLVISSSS